MRFLAACMLTVLSVNTFASQVKVYESLLSEFYADYGPIRFALDEKTGEAWAVMKEIDYSTPEPISFNTNIKIPLLRYDQVSESITYNNKIICAKVISKRSFFQSHKAIVPNGNCEFSIEYSINKNREKIAQIFLNIR